MATVNPWTKFKELLPARGKYILTITATNADGTVTGTIRDGSALRVIGTGTVGSQVWVEDGRVAGPAPTLPFYSVDV